MCCFLGCFWWFLVVWWFVLVFCCVVGVFLCWVFVGWGCGVGLVCGFGGVRVAVLGFLGVFWWLKNWLGGVLLGGFTGRNGVLALLLECILGPVLCIAFSVPLSSSSWWGIVRVCFVPLCRTLLSFAWLPFWETVSKPNWEMIFITFFPLRTLSFGIGWQLEID